MIAEKKKAIALTTAYKNEAHTKACLSATMLSRIKIQIGQLLLFENPNWQEIESALREYYMVQL